MQARLEVLSGPRAGQSVELPVGRSTQVGRAAEMQFAIPEDEGMARVHFALEWDGRICRLRDMSGRVGTLLNGQRAYNATITAGDRITAGNSVFSLRVDE